MGNMRELKEEVILIHGRHYGPDATCKRPGTKRPIIVCEASADIFQNSPIHETEARAMVLGAGDKE